MVLFNKLCQINIFYKIILICKFACLISGILLKDYLKVSLLAIIDEKYLTPDIMHSSSTLKSGE